MALQPNDVVQGFQTDCMRLINQFEQLETVRFEGFCDIWTDMNFSLVLTGRKSIADLLEFCQDSLIVGKEFFMPPFSFKERIGGLYLLYGLYFKAAVDGTKIRVTMSEWHDIIDFQAEIGQAEHHDASYVLAKLISENAFSHCIFPREFGLEKGYRLRANLSLNPYSVLPDIREIAGPRDLFDRINMLSKLYESSKSLETKRFEVAGSSTILSPGLQWYDSRFGEKLLESVKQFENSRKNNKIAIARTTIRDKTAMKGDALADGNEDRVTKCRLTPDVIRNRQGHGFDTDSSDSEIEECVQSLEKDKSLPDFFDDSSFSD